MHVLRRPVETTADSRPSLHVLGIHFAIAKAVIPNPLVWGTAS
jgi:hypothetical protein